VFDPQTNKDLQDLSGPCAIKWVCNTRITSQSDVRLEVEWSEDLTLNFSTFYRIINGRSASEPLPNFHSLLRKSETSIILQLCYEQDEEIK